MPNSDILRGWKEIEAFLGIGRKTILHHSYPIRKEGSGKQGPVFALRAELQEALKQRRFHHGRA